MLKLTNDNGPLAQIWLASNMTNIPRGSVLQTNVIESAKEIAEVAGCGDTIEETTEDEDGNKYITLRTSGELLQGIVQVYAKQAGFLLSDIKDILTKISSLFKRSSRVGITINKSNTITRIESITLEDTVTEKEVLLTPSLDFLFESGSTTIGDNRRRNIQGVTMGAHNAVWDTSIEVGRQNMLNDNDYSGNNSILDLNFDIGEDQLEIGDEGTRNTGMNSNEISTAGIDHMLFHQDDDPLIDNNLENNWNLDIGDNHLEGNDSSIELGRRAESSVLEEEHTEFGFDLGLEKENMMEGFEEEVQEHVQENSNTLNLLSNPRRPHNLDPALIDTGRIIIDDDRVLSKKELHDVTTNSQSINNSNTRNSAKSITKKRLWNEIENDTSYINTSITNTLIRYASIKKPRNDNEDIPEEEVQLDINNESIDNMEMINDNFDTLQGNEQGNEEQDILPGFGNMGLSMENETPGEIENARILDEVSQSSETPSTIVLPDQVRLISGELVSKDTVDMAATLRTVYEKSNEYPKVTFPELLAKQLELNEDTTNNEEMTDSVQTRKDASQCFFDMLTLASAGCVSLHQEAPFAEISLTVEKTINDKFIPENSETQVLA